MNNSETHNSPSYYIDGILKCNTAILSRAITIIESKNPEHRTLANQIIDGVIHNSGNSFRLGITGVPGVGKSTFIESFGKELLNHGHKVAVLAIDPSSTKSKGSILGDKTRMNFLAAQDKVFIRPSPSSGSLGGVAQATYETILVCEAAGFDFIIVETVGVGQSEIAVSKMTDFFLLLMLAGAGDDLQGIKRGIMEMADLILITKADGDNKDKANIARAQYANAIHFFPPTESGWIPKVETCSSTEEKGILHAYQIIDEYKNFTTLNGYFNEKRKIQQLEILRETLNSEIVKQFYLTHQIEKKLDNLKLKDIINPFSEANKLLKEKD
ncbi:MAG: methylmalonyl Co-A mutase-associated GTPase MeaB [Bacteroidia bacterium]|nr:methylmalonyl Co-A mutase-associated GTPase MeaB [Bacteroidia bacterium]